MSEFTRGEWKVFTDIFNSSEVRSYNSENSHAFDLIASNTYIPDAHLIAAAPEMYEMLTSLAEDYGIFNKTRKDIQALLAKARGEGEL